MQNTNFFKKDLISKIMQKFIMYDVLGIKIHCMRPSHHKRTLYTLKSENFRTPSSSST